MIPLLAYSVMAGGLLLAGWTGLSAMRRRAVSGPQLGAAAFLEAVLIVQSAIAVARLISGQAIGEPATFVAYSVGVLAPLALGGYLARIERTRWGSTALCFTLVVVAVMTLRLLQIWRSGGAHA